MDTGQKDVNGGTGLMDTGRKYETGIDGLRGAGAGRAEDADLMKACRLCPRNCGADRSAGRMGACGVTAEIRVGRAALHMWEEPCISGKQGSGTVFFAGCSLGCVYCQNAELSGARAGAVKGRGGRAGRPDSRDYTYIQEEKNRGIYIFGNRGCGAVSGAVVYMPLLHKGQKIGRKKHPADQLRAFCGGLPD